LRTARTDGCRHIPCHNSRRRHTVSRRDRGHSAVGVHATPDNHAVHAIPVVMMVVMMMVVVVMIVIVVMLGMGGGRLV
jgi:hypothetical protein